VTVTLVVLIAAGLWLALWWEDRVWTRNHPPHHEPPSRLDVLDGANPPADRHPDPLPPGVGSAGRSAGATTDPWMP
jgi:hypothetical protein